MKGQTLISIRAFTILTFFFTIGTSILIAPNVLALGAKQDAWMAAIVGIMINVSLVWIYGRLAERHPGQTLVQFSEAILGKWLGKLVGVAFALFCYLLASLMIGDLGYFLSSQILIETPIEFLEAMFVVAIVITIRQGMRGYALAAELLFQLIIVMLFLFMLPLLPKVDLHRLKPVLEFGWKPVVKGGLSFFALQELSVLLMIYPYVRSGIGRRRGYIIGTALGGFVLVLTVVGSIGVLGSSLSANHLYPVYTLAKNIRVGRFLERIEGVMIFIWVCSIFIKITLTFHAALLGFSQSLGIRDRRVLMWPLAMGLIVIAQMCYTNTFYIQSFLSTSWAPFAMVFLVIIPLLLLCISWIKFHGSKS